MPSEIACELIQFVGKNTAKKNMKQAADTRMKRSSFKGLIKSIIVHGLGFGLSLDRTVAIDTSNNTRNRKATERSAQPKPTDLCG